MPVPRGMGGVFFTLTQAEGLCLCPGVRAAQKCPASEEKPASKTRGVDSVLLVLGPLFQGRHR